MPVAGLALLLMVSVHVVTQPEGRRVPVATVDSALAGAHCVAADSAAALVLADVLTRDLRDHCQVVVDVTGLTYDQDRGDLPSGRTPSARRQDHEWQRSVDHYLSAADAVVLDQWRSDGLDARELARLEHRDLELGKPRTGCWCRRGDRRTPPVSGGSRPSARAGRSAPPSAGGSRTGSVMPSRRNGLAIIRALVVCRAGSGGSGSARVPMLQLAQRAGERERVAGDRRAGRVGLELAATG